MSVKKFCSIVKLTFLTNFAYIKAFWLNIIGTAVSIVVYYFLWQYVFQKQETIAGFTMAQMTTYVILSRVLSSQFSGGINMEFADWIYEGTIGMELLRPISLFFNLFAKRMGEFLFFVLFKGLPITVICIFVMGGSAPFGAAQFLLFVVSVLISIGLMFFIEFMVGLCSFYTFNNHGLRFMKSSLLSILSGGVVPIFFFPEAIVKVLDYMPFAGMVSVPVQIYMGKYGMTESIKYIGLQLVWCILLFGLAKFFYAKSIRKVVVQGG